MVKVEIGMGPRKPGGSSPQGAVGDKAPMTRGSTQNQKVSGKKCQQNSTRHEMRGASRPASWSRKESPTLGET